MSTDRIFPMVMISLDEFRIMRELLGKLRNALRKGTSLILLCIPVHKIHFMKKSFHRLFVILKITPVHVPGIPFDQNVPEVKQNGLNIRSHSMILPYLEI